jgi:MoxR-like ATPase
MLSTVQAKRIIKAAIFTRTLGEAWGLPLLLIGPRGSGKSSVVRQEVKRCSLSCETMIASICEPADFNGLPVIREDGVNFVPHAKFIRASKAERAVIFLDEITTAPLGVQHALLRVVLEGVAGDLHMPPSVRFVAAANPPEEAGGYALTGPLATRFCQVQVSDPEVSEFSAYLLGGGADASGAVIDASAEERRVDAAWPAAFGKASGLVSAFLRVRPELLGKPVTLTRGAPVEADLSQPTPRPRTWEFAARALAGAQIHGLTETERDALLAGFLGAGTAAEFAAFVTNADLPDPEELLTGKVKWKHDPKRLDRTAAITASLGAYVSAIALKDSKRADKLAAAAWKIFGTIAGEAADLVVIGAKPLYAAKLHFGGEAGTAARPVLAAIQPVLAAGGVS